MDNALLDERERKMTRGWTMDTDRTSNRPATRIQRTNQVRYLVPPKIKVFISEAISACLTENYDIRKKIR